MPATFSRYQIFVIALLAFLQFTIVLDFMILSPLGALLLDQLHITTQQFGLVVSAYAFSAGASGLLAAGFADRFDRKRMLLFFYTGFVLGTFLCAIANTYEFLLMARVVTGLFGGVIGSISFAIIADLFPMEVRGRVMGFVQTAFSASQVFGLPAGLYLSNLWGWHAPFMMIVVASAAVGILIFARLQPIDGHLKVATATTTNPFKHLFATVSQRRYLVAFGATMLLATGGFMLMPFGSAFTVHNMGIPLEQLPMIYVVTGACSIVAGPLVGRLADALGKYLVFCLGSALAIGVVVYYCQLGVTPLWLVILTNVFMFVAVSARMISASALTSAVPDLKDRGAFMAVNSSLQQLSGGVASSVAGLIVVQTAAGPLQRYDVLGYVVSVAMLITMGLMYFIHRAVMHKGGQSGFTPAAKAA
ncbi:MAG: MFS transporter [Myxococcota bacterium]